MTVRRAEPSDAVVIGRLLHDFNAEFREPTPPPETIAERMRELLPGGEPAVLLAEPGPSGLAVLRFRAGIYDGAPECYLAELYVVPEQRGRGIGRSLMESALDLARAEGAAYMDLGTSEADVAARGLYESLGFSRRGGKPDGPLEYFYELEL
jgi:ribosomal protein S18 acetylase RimI-like enzyme